MAIPITIETASLHFGRFGGKNSFLSYKTVSIEFPPCPKTTERDASNKPRLSNTTLDEVQRHSS